MAKVKSNGAAQKPKGSLVEDIGVREKLAYGLGDLASNLVLVITMSLISYYYTNVIGLPVATVGTITLVSMLFDGFSDILMGVILDKTKSKHGKARPWLLWLAIPFGVATILLMLIPTNASLTVKTVYAFVTFNLLTTVLYTAINIPYGALNSLMTRDQHQRSVINIYRMTMAQVGSMIINAVTLPLINKLGGEKKHWIMVVSVYAVLASVMFLITFFGTKERVVSSEGASTANIPIRESFKAMLKNKYWMMIVLQWVIMAFGMSFAGMSSIYYTQYILGDSSYVGLINLASALPGIVAMFLMAPLIKKFGKRNVALMGLGITIVGSIAILFNPTNLTYLLICNAIKGIGAAGMSATLFAMVADTIEYGEWKTGIRVEGMLYSATTFGAKVGAGIGVAIGSYVLSRAAFDGMQATQPQTALSAIHNMYLIVPIAFNVISVVVYLFYNLDKEYPQIIKELQEKDSKSTE